VNSSYYVLIDSSVWIDFFRGSKNDLLEGYIKEGLAVTNEIILTELAPALIKNNQTEIVESLQTLPCIPLDVDWDIIRKYQLINLENGINKVGIPDLMILQQVISNRMSIFSLDKHFRLMSEVLEFELITGKLPI